MKNLIRFSPITLLLLASCASTNDPGRIDNALLSELSPNNMAKVVDARATKDVAEDSLAEAERNTRWAGEQVELTRSNLKVARTELDDAKLAMVTAERSGTVSQLAKAKQAHEYSMARTDEVHEARKEYEVYRVKAEALKTGN